MPLSYEDARNAIVTAFLSQWQSGASAAVGYEPEIAYDNVFLVEPTDRHWARLSIQHTAGRQATFGPVGERHFRRSGLVTLQIFLLADTGLSDGDKLAEIAVAAFEGISTDDGVWFRNVRSNEVGFDGVWFQINVVAEFEYDKMR